MYREETNGHDAVHVTLIIKSIQLNMWIAEGSVLTIEKNGSFFYFNIHGD